MPQLSQNFNVPDMVNSVASDLALMRTNQWFILASAANGSIVIPGWSTSIVSTSSPVNYGEPDAIQLSYTDTTVSPNVTHYIYINLTWTSGNVTTMVLQYGRSDQSPQMETITGGAITLTYDGSGNFTGATSA